eukprot:gene23258-30486_t
MTKIYMDRGLNNHPADVNGDPWGCSACLEKRTHIKDTFGEAAAEEAMHMCMHCVKQFDTSPAGMTSGSYQHYCTGCAGMQDFEWQGKCFDCVMDCQDIDQCVYRAENKLAIAGCGKEPPPLKDDDCDHSPPPPPPEDDCDKNSPAYQDPPPPPHSSEDDAARQSPPYDYPPYDYPPNESPPINGDSGGTGADASYGDYPPYEGIPPFDPNAYNGNAEGDYDYYYYYD